MIASLGLNLGGWLVMLVSISMVCGLFGWCLYRVLTGPRDPGQTLHGMNIKTPDTDTTPKK